MTNEENKSNNQKDSFWDSVVGKTIRWIIYIPFGLTVSYLIIALATLNWIWLSGDLFIIRLLLGGEFVMLLWGFLYYIIISHAVGSICPNTKTGCIIFGIAYYLFHISFVKHILTNDPPSLGITLFATVPTLAAMTITGYILLKNFTNNN